MRVCFIVDEIFNWSRYGGFGALTRTIGSELAKRGIEVFILMPQNSSEQRIIESLDGMTIIGVPSKHRYFSIDTSKRASPFFKLCDADVYHSEEASVASYFTAKAESSKKHVITFQDPRDIIAAKIGWNEIANYQRNIFKRWLLPQIFKAETRFKKKGMDKADLLFCQAKYIIPKVRSMYNLKTLPEFLPNPVKVPNNVSKAKEPTVCFVARLDKVKQPELFFNLAVAFPDVHFIVAGAAHDKDRQRYLIDISKDINNLEIRGFVDEKTKSDIFTSSWIYVNTSIRECLPVAFLEAASHKCAILSSENPDNFAEDFGYRVKENNLESYIQGLNHLLHDELWKTKGEKGYRYVKDVHEMDKVIDRHIMIYQNLLGTTV